MREMHVVCISTGNDATMAVEMLTRKSTDVPRPPTRGHGPGADRETSSVRQDIVYDSTWRVEFASEQFL